VLIKLGDRETVGEGDACADAVVLARVEAADRIDVDGRRRRLYVYAFVFLVVVVAIPRAIRRDLGEFNRMHLRVSSS